jgi:hypothetical protein
MSIKEEGYLHDYLAASFVGLAYGLIVSQAAGGAIGNWGIYIALLIVAGIFGFIPGGFVAGYINFRFHRMGENLEMAGLSAGFFTAVVFTIVNFFLALVAAVLLQPAAGNIMISWIISVLFAFIFFSLGGYISGYFERRPFAMPTIFNLSRISRAPLPPPVAAAQLCPTCGRPMTFIQQYNRWYCPNCKKYP